MDLHNCIDTLKAAAPSGMIKNKKKHIGDIFHDANDAGVVIHFLELSLTKKNIKQNVSVYYFQGVLNVVSGELIVSSPDEITRERLEAEVTLLDSEREDKYEVIGNSTVLF